MTSRFGAVAAALVAAAFWAAPAIAGPLTNGGFEAGSLAGWTGSAAGANSGFITYTGTPSVGGAAAVDAPPEGTTAVVSSQNGPGQAILYQDVTLPASGTITLSLYVYYQASASIATLPNLSYTGGANEQFRVDVMDPAAPLASLAGGDVLANVFKTTVGDPVTLAPTLVSADLSAFAGQTVRLRIAEVDNQSNLQASVDGISITSGGGGTGGSRVGYCAAAGDTNPFTGAALTPGSFVDLLANQPGDDSHYAGATLAIFVQGDGITCNSPPAGYTEQGKATATQGVAAGVYDYWAEP